MTSVSWRIGRNEQHRLLQDCLEGTLERRRFKIEMHVRLKKGRPGVRERARTLNCTLAGTWASQG